MRPENTIPAFTYALSVGADVLELDVVVTRDNALVVAEADREFPLLSLDRVPLTHHGRIRFQVENALAAVAATWSRTTVSRSTTAVRMRFS